MKARKFSCFSFGMTAAAAGMGARRERDYHAPAVLRRDGADRCVPQEKKKARNGLGTCRRYTVIVYRLFSFAGLRAKIKTQKKTRHCARSVGGGGHTTVINTLYYTDLYIHQCTIPLAYNRKTIHITIIIIIII